VTPARSKRWRMPLARWPSGLRLESPTGRFSSCFLFLLGRVRLYRTVIQPLVERPHAWRAGCNLVEPLNASTEHVTMCGNAIHDTSNSSGQIKQGSLPRRRWLGPCMRGTMTRRACALRGLGAVSGQRGGAGSRWPRWRGGTVSGGRAGGRDRRARRRARWPARAALSPSEPPWIWRLFSTCYPGVCTLSGLDTQSSEIGLPEAN
jgi:hypothetical protein